jgi:hypothetical protein
VAVIEALAEIFSAVWSVISEVVAISQATSTCFGRRSRDTLAPKLALNEFSRTR